MKICNPPLNMKQSVTPPLRIDEKSMTPPSQNEKKITHKLGVGFLRYRDSLCRGGMKPYSQLQPFKGFCIIVI